MRKARKKLLGVFLAASLAMTAVVPMHGVAAEDAGEVYADGTGLTAAGRSVEGQDDESVQMTEGAAPGEGQKPEAAPGGNPTEGEEGASGEELLPGEEGISREDMASGDEGMSGENQASEEGTSGENPASGEDGTTGENPASGEDGTTGEDPAVGEDGTTGEDPASGEDGTTGEDPASREDGTSREDPASGNEQNPGGGVPSGGEQIPGDAAVSGEEQVPAGDAVSGGTQDSVQEPDEEGMDGVIQTPESGKTDGVQTPGGEITSGGIQKPEGETGGVLPVGAEGTAADGMLPQDADAGIVAAAENYDITQPVIESFEFLENGQELTAGDTLNFNISAYDADSGIQAVRVYVSSEDGYGGDVSFAKEEGSNLYKGTLDCSQLIGTQFYISSITVTDMAGNYTNGEVTDGDGQYLYKFTLNGKVRGDISISDIQMQTNDVDGDGKLSIDDTVVYTVKFACVDESIANVDMVVGLENGGISGNLRVESVYDDATQTATATCIISEETYPGIWWLYNIQVSAESGYTYWFSQEEMGEDADLKFTVSQEGEYDSEKPVIQSIILDRNGEMLKAGDAVTMRVKVLEEHPADTAYAMFIPAAANVEQTISITLELDADTGEYAGTAEITEDTYPCEWDLDQLGIGDQAGNYTYLYDFEENYAVTRPWYFRVTADTYVENTKDVTFNFYGLTKQDSGNHYYYNLISTETASNVGRRASLKELGLTFPQTESVEGLNLVKWKYNGVAADEDTQLVFDNTSGNALSYDFYADYDKGCVNVWLTYRNQNGDSIGKDMVMFLDKDTTYKDVLDSLELPEDAYTDGFIGFRFNNEYEVESTKVGDAATIGVTANYDKGCVRVYLTYLAKDGYSNSTNVVKYVDKEATYKDVLDLLELPEDAQTDGFAGFQVRDCDENTKVGDEAYLAVNAGYTSYQINGTAIYSDEEGNAVTVFLDKTYPAGTKVKEILADLGEEPAAVGGAGFEKWILPYNTMDGEDEVSLDMRSFRAIAAYSGKTTVEVQYSYRQEGGGRAYEHRVLLLDGDNVSTADIRSEAGKAVGSFKHMDGLKLVEWKNDVYYENVERYRSIAFTAVYSGCVVELSYPDGSEYIAVDEGAQFTLPVENERYENLVWYGHDQGAAVTVTGDMYFYVTSCNVKDTSVPSGPSDPGDDNPSDPGDTPAPDNPSASGNVPAPSDPDDAGNDDQPGTDNPGAVVPPEDDNTGDDTGVTDQPGNGSTGDDNTDDTDRPGDDVSGDNTGDNTGSDTGNTVKPGDNSMENNTGNDPGSDGGQGNSAGTGSDSNAGSTGTTNNAGGAGSAEGIKVPESVIKEVTVQIEEAARRGGNATLNVDMKEATVVPREILESARGKDVRIVFNMGGYQWAINGKDIAATNLKDINLEVKMDVNAIPTSLVRALAGGQPTRQLSLTHNGDFGFRADLILNLGSENKEKVGNLYYYDSTGKLVFMNAGNIREDGTTVLSFSHASDYVIVISGKAAGDAVKTGDSGSRLKSPKTGE